MNFIGLKGDVKYYMRDYGNIEKREDIPANEFEDLIKSNFPEFTVRKQTTTLTGKEREVCSVVENKGETVFFNKGFICIKEATDQEKGIIIGIHDYTNYKAFYLKG